MNGVDTLINSVHCTKFYANVILDDNAGFSGSEDWFLIEKELKNINNNLI